MGVFAVGPVNEDWLLDHRPDAALRTIAAVAGRQRELTVESPVAGVLIITHRYVTIPVRVAGIALIPFTMGVSLFALVFAKSVNRVTVRSEPDGDGTRLVIEGRTPPALLEDLRLGLDLGTPTAA